MISDVSIVITNYNYGKYIARCIRSCLNQKNCSPDIIIVDDCSTDDSYSSILPFIDRVKYVKLEKNAGVAKASNYGIRMSTNRFFVRVDADDFINENLCLFLRKYLSANKDVFGVSCDYVLVDNQEREIERKYAEEEPVSCGIMYRRDQFLENGGYNENFRHREEEEIRKRMGDAYKVDHMKIPFYRYRMHNDNKTKSDGYKECKV
jgi:glycosyltransferase involved in cell wall biosynthesis